VVVDFFSRKGESMFTEMMRKRRSVRKYTAKKVEQEKIDALLEAALRAPSARGARPWALVVVKDKALLEKLSVSKPGGGAFLKDSPMGIVVCGDPSKSGLWIEDSTIAAVSMQYAAHSLGLASCWVQIKGNNFSAGKSSSAYITELLGLPDNMEVLCIVAVGYPADETVPYKKEDLPFDKVSYERYGRKRAEV